MILGYEKLSEDEVGTHMTCRLGQWYVAWRFWHILHLSHTRRRNDRRSSMGVFAAGNIRIVNLDMYRFPSWNLRGKPAWPDRRHRGDGRNATGRRNSKFLVCDDAGVVISNQSSLVFGRRISGLGRRVLGRRQGTYPARDCLGPAAGGGAVSEH